MFEGVFAMTKLTSSPSTTSTEAEPSTTSMYRPVRDSVLKTASVAEYSLLEKAEETVTPTVPVPVG